MSRGDRRLIAIATGAARVNKGRCAAISRRGDSRTFKLRRSTVSGPLYVCVPGKHCIHLELSDAQSQERN